MRIQFSFHSPLADIGLCVTIIIPPREDAPMDDRATLEKLARIRETADRIAVQVGGTFKENQEKRSDFQRRARSCEGLNRVA